ncbi:magnesium/cobalt transporter CorA [Clostridium malenominatum]|uniref:Magnesium transport protein CorA n=1 Tax=Clostridium malenominatum TaxID=1539 RepID=A0ABP3U6K6_9CLOT
MHKNLKKLKKKSYTAPGSLIHIGDEITHPVKISYIEYSNDYYKFEDSLDNIYDCFNENDTVKWINVDGLNNISMIKEIGNYFNIHPLVQEDILNTTIRPKIDDHHDYIFVVTKMLYINELGKLTVEQVSFILTSNYVVSFQEFSGDVFDPLRERIKSASNIRKFKTDYLLYSLIDGIVDSYFNILENIGDRIDSIEDELLLNPENKLLQDIYTIKREMLFLRNSIWPLREVVNNLTRMESTLINEKTIVFFRDIYDHNIQIIDTVETYRDILAGMLDTYLSSISNKTNDVMKILTIYSTIFIPLSFLAGVYGMNFNNMPELNWKYGYPSFWIISLILIIVMLRYFKRKDWI